MQGVYRHISAGTCNAKHTYAPAHLADAAQPGDPAVGYKLRPLRALWRGGGRGVSSGSGAPATPNSPSPHPHPPEQSGVFLHLGMDGQSKPKTRRSLESRWPRVRVSAPGARSTREEAEEVQKEGMGGSGKGVEANWKNVRKEEGQVGNWSSRGQKVGGDEPPGGSPRQALGPRCESASGAPHGRPPPVAAPGRPDPAGIDTGRPALSSRPPWVRAYTRSACLGRQMRQAWVRNACRPFAPLASSSPPLEKK